nr:hypothetical protein [Haemophilus haemolyticus]
MARLVSFAFTIFLATASAYYLLARDISVEKALEKVERAYAKLDVKL